MNRSDLKRTEPKPPPGKKWDPYLSERQWGTVREDYSENGDAWNYFTHDQARSRTYRWGEDGLAGVSDERQRVCFALALWNGNDPILKERLFGLTNSEGNHGEDVKEYYFYLDSTPTHSYMKYLYKYPQAAYPYEELIVTNRERGRGFPEYELLDTGIFDEDRYFDLFVEYDTGATIGSLEEFRRNYDAVFLGLGTQRARLIPIEGVHQPFVLGGLDFLHAVRSGEPVRVGPRVVVIGGGNVSIDVALTALRQGAQHVALTSLEKRRDMPASPHEIELAVAEGVEVHAGWGPVSIDEDGQVILHFCERTRDESGGFNPIFDENRLMTLAADHVILATGQGTDLSILDGSVIENNHGFIVADPQTLMTKTAGVFAGGDVEHGPRTAVEAIRSGKIAAASIDGWLRKVSMDPLTGQPVRRADVIPLHIVAHDRTHLPRAMMPERTVEEVLGEGNYVQIEEGLTDAMAHDEAQRCLRCDVCIGCGLCMVACSEMGVEALRMADTQAGRLAYFDFMRPSTLCIGCGACTQVCPTGAIHFEDRDGMRRTIITGSVVKEQPLLACSECGAPTQTAAHREFIRNRMPGHMAALLDRELCPDCARLRADRPGSGKKEQIK